MKIENLAFSLIIMLMAVILLTVLGWGCSFMWVSEVTLTESGGKVGDTDLFMIRVFMGICFMGMMNGIYKLWDLFVFCMKQAPTTKKD